MRVSVVIALILGFASANVLAAEDFSSALSLQGLERISGGADVASAVSISSLNASVTHSSVQFHPAGPMTIEGNRVENAMNGSTGVMGIVQNNGAGSNVLQAITVSIGELHLTPASRL